MTISSIACIAFFFRLDEISFGKDLFLKRGGLFAIQSVLLDDDAWKVFCVFLSYTSDTLSTAHFIFSALSTQNSHQI